MLARLIELVTGDSETPEHRAETRDVPMLASFLGYRAYAAETQIFHLTRSKGFILELAPLMGADERIGDILTSIISDVLVAGCEFQIINYASPRIAEKLQEWALPRIRAGAVFNKLARYRLDLLRGGAWTSLATDGPFHLRQFRVLFAVGVGAGSGVDTETLLAVRDGITSALDSINVKTRIFSPTELIRFIDDVVCPATGAGDDAPDYSPFDPINEQCIRRDLVTRVEKDRLILEAPSLRPSGLVIDGARKWPI
jgi:conjugal transfer ATP-binding protein TraC